MAEQEQMRENAECFQCFLWSHRIEGFFPGLVQIFIDLF